MAESYREILRKDYSLTHAAAARPLTREDMSYQARVFHKTFGSLLPAERSATIFEAGCGSGSFLHYLQSEGYDASGMDFDSSSVAQATALGIKNATTGDAFTFLKGKSIAFDVIVAIDVLEHLTKDELFAALAAVRGALKPGGVLIWRAPNAESLSFGRIRYGDLTHELAFTRHSAAQAMAASGFTTTTILGEGPVVTGARSLLRALLWAAFKPAVRLYLYAESCEISPLLEPNLIVAARKS